MNILRLMVSCPFRRCAGEMISGGFFYCDKLIGLNKQLSSLANATNLPSKNFLTPQVPLVNLVNGLKQKGRPKRRCKDCYLVIRQERLYVMCKTHPRHKQMSIKPPDKKTWILSHATQSPIRPW